jgi:hypothetical protein
MQTVAIDRTKGVRKSALVTHEEAAAIDDYRLYRRADLGKIPSESQAVAELIRRGLEQFKREQETNPRGKS